MHGQTDADEAEYRCFFIEAVNKSVYDAMLNHNEVFLNTFNNTMKEVVHGFPVDQVGPAYYNIPYPLTQGTNQAATSYQEAASADNDDIQVIQISSEQIQGATNNQIQHTLLTSDPYTTLFCRNGMVSLQQVLLSQRFSLLVAIDWFFAMKIVLWP